MCDADGSGKNNTLKQNGFWVIAQLGVILDALPVKITNSSNAILSHFVFSSSLGFIPMAEVFYFSFFPTGQAEAKWVQCMYFSNNNCRYPFQITTEPGQTELHIITRAGINTLKHSLCLHSRSLPLLPLQHYCTLEYLTQQACCQCYSCILHFLSVPISL